MQRSLWDEMEQDPRGREQHIALEGGELILIPNWLSQSTADLYFQRLLKQVEWQQSILRFAGKAIPIPRFNAWYGEPDTAYRYSGIHFSPLSWNRPLAVLRQRVQRTIDSSPSVNTRFQINSALVNYYRDGQDSVAWHADDEAELGPMPQIASVSFGAERRFILRPRSTRRGERMELALGHGSLLLMLGETQKHWLHCVPKTRKAVEGRINATFRQVLHAAF